MGSCSGHLDRRLPQQFWLAMGLVDSVVQPLGEHISETPGNRPDTTRPCEGAVLDFLTVGLGVNATNDGSQLLLYERDVLDFRSRWCGTLSELADFFSQRRD